MLLEISRTYGTYVLILIASDGSQRLDKRRLPSNVRPGWYLVACPWSSVCSDAYPCMAPVSSKPARLIWGIMRPRVQNVERRWSELLRRAQEATRADTNTALGLPGDGARIVWGKLRRCGETRPYASRRPRSRATRSRELKVEPRISDPRSRPMPGPRRISGATPTLTLPGIQE